MMQRRHYELLAGAISEAAELHRRRYQDRWPLDGETVVSSIADALANDNPRFDRERFLKASGVSE